MQATFRVVKIEASRLTVSTCAGDENKMQDNIQQNNIQQNTTGKWWQQEAFSEQRLQGLDGSDQGGNHIYHADGPKDAASLLAEELRRKDAHIAKLEAMLRQAEGTPTEHERRPEAFLPTGNSEPAADRSDTFPAPANGAMVYASLPVVPEIAAGSANSMAADNASRVGGAMVYDAPPVALRDTRIRLEDMNLEHSPIAQIVMQAAARRQAEPVPVFEPTLRMQAQGAQQPTSARSVQDNPARRRQLAVVGGLGLLAFAGVIGALQMRAPHREPTLITPPPALDRAAFAAVPVKVSKPDAVSSPLDVSSSAIEILPAVPAPQAIKHTVRYAGGAHIAAVPRSVPDIPKSSYHDLPKSASNSEPLPPSSAPVPIMHYPVHAVHVVHSVQPRVHAVASAAHIRKSAAPSSQAETSGIIVEASEERARVASTSHSEISSASRSDTPLPTGGAETPIPSRRAEALPSDTRDTYGDSRESGYRARRGHGYRYSQPEPTETRRSAYKYGEGANRRSGDDVEYAHHSVRGNNERTNERNNEKSDAWMDERPDR